MKRFIVGLIAVLMVVSIAACGGNSPKKSATGQQQENIQQSQDETSLVAAQPLPHFNYSQIRQNAIEIETAQAKGVQTTTFFFNLGGRDPIQSCPSIGAPIATTTQISNPQQQVRMPDGGGYNLNRGDNVVPQMDPNGVYTGDSSGTYVMCLNDQGQAYANYWEGFVQTIFGSATWNYNTHQVQLIGSPSFHFTKGK